MSRENAIEFLSVREYISCSLGTQPGTVEMSIGTDRVVRLNYAQLAAVIDLLRKRQEELYEAAAQSAATQGNGGTPYKTVLLAGA